MLSYSRLASTLRNIVLLTGVPPPVSRCGFKTATVMQDWIRRSTARKPELYKIPRQYTVLEEEIIDPSPRKDTTLEDESLAKDVISTVNENIRQNTARCFAVVHVAGKQFKVTPEDLIMVKTPLFGTEIGDRVRLEKVLLLGSKDFTLIGRPILAHSQAYVEAQVIEKTLEHPKLWFQFHRRRRHRRMRIFQDNVAVLRITAVRTEPLDEQP